MQLAGSACFPSVNQPKTWSIPDPVNPGQFILDPKAEFGGEFHPDGKPDTYKDPRRVYQAIEIEANKSFGHNWALNANWRIARLNGNYEGAFRNDNNQADPGISSLFDLTEGKLGLLAQQQGIGPLNTDRRHVVNVNAFYATQYAFERAYGNYLGLCWLGRFVAHEMGLTLASVSCFTGVISTR